MKVHEQLRELRARSRVKLQVVADACGVSRQAISLLELTGGGSFQSYLGFAESLGWKIALLDQNGDIVLASSSLPAFQKYLNAKRKDVGIELTDVCLPNSLLASLERFTKGQLKRKAPFRVVNAYVVALGLTLSVVKHEIEATTVAA